MDYLGKKVKILFDPDSILPKNGEFLVIAHAKDIKQVVIYREDISGHNAQGGNFIKYLKGYEKSEERNNHCWCMEEKDVEIYVDFKEVFNKITGDVNVR